jgi:hypothetical protein
MSANRTALAAVGAALALGGCGIGAGSTPNAPIKLTVTRDFGARAVLENDDAKVAGADTVMRVLQRNATTRTRFGGQFVQSIDGVSGGRRGDRPYDWFIYVNGILTDQGAGAVDVRGGDRIWWDHHDWGVTPDVRAVVGSFPEPFVHGSEGKRLPVRVECVDPNATACRSAAASSARARRTSRCGSSSARGRSCAAETPSPTRSTADRRRAASSRASTRPARS